MNQQTMHDTAQTADDAFQMELRMACLASAPEQLETMRRLFRAYSQDRNQAQSLQELFRVVHSMTGNTGLSGLRTIAAVAAPFEELLRELHENPDRVNASVLRTVAQAIDAVAMLFSNVDCLDDTRPVTGRVLVVDDELIARRAVLHALAKVKLQATPVDDPRAALRVAAEREFDLITLDIEMPGMNGLELCSRLVEMRRHQSTPILFVTSLSDFEHRAQACLRGGNDLIGKPFPYLELGIKALIAILRFQVLQQKADRAAEPKAGVETP